MNLWLDDCREPWKFGALGYEWAKTAGEAIALLKAGGIEFASLDHDLGLCDDCLASHDVEGVKLRLIRNPGCASYCSCPHNGTGYDVVCWMEEHNIWPPEGVRVHSANPVGAARMQTVIDRHYQEAEDKAR